VTWFQNYNPLGNTALSTLVAALPVVMLLVSIAILRIRIHLAAVIGLAAAMLVAVLAFSMPLSLVATTAAYGAAFGLFPIGWLILNIMFLYQLTVRQGRFEMLRKRLAGIAPDARIQLILIAFAFGAFLEGVAGFGAPVAITAAILIQLGFRPLHASALALIANTAPVAFGGLGIPIYTLSNITGIDELALSKMVGRQLLPFSLLVPFWVVTALSGWRGLKGVWPAALTAGVAFAIPQFLVSNFHGPRLVAIASASSCIVAVSVLLRFWKPKELWRYRNGRLSRAPRGMPMPDGNDAPAPAPTTVADDTPAPQSDPAGAASRAGFRAWIRPWLPWIVLCAVILGWGLFKDDLNRLSDPKWPVAGLHLVVQRVPPVAASAEKAIFEFSWLSASGTGVLLAAILAGWVMGASPRTMLGAYFKTIARIRLSLLTIAAMLAVGYVTKYSGTDATLGLALAQTGSYYPFFGTMLGWLGVAMTGSDTSSNALFGGLQKITANQIGISPILMAAANSSGGVMGKMIDAQSIVVATTATNWYGHESDILRYVFWHSLALATLMGALVYLQAYVAPFTAMVVK
jgi:lactate permease